MLDAVEFSKIRYFRRVDLDDEGAGNFYPGSVVISLKGFQPDAVNVDGREITASEALNFLKKYLRLTHCDLFFSDAAILVEGAVEKLLLPKMIDVSAQKLNAKYITILEVGGAYTNRAVGVISSRLGYDELFTVTTLHGFLWGEVSRFQAPLREALISHVIPAHIAKAQLDDNGGNSKKAIAARKKIERLQAELVGLSEDKPNVRYEETTVSDYSKCVLNHDDIIEVASHLITTKAMLQKGLGFKYPYIFVDEAQDTFPEVMAALNSICANEGLPIIGYFGDPMQQIYDKRAGDFSGPEGSVTIAKKENFRCSVSVINLLNHFRDDVEQFPAGKNAEIEGSVGIIIARAPNPEGPRKTYTPEQLDHVSKLFRKALENWDWQDDPSVKKLFLARQMIARQLDFLTLHRLFTGTYSSSRSQSDYEDGTHYLLKPFVDGIYPLISASINGDEKRVLEVLRQTSPSFYSGGVMKATPVKSWSPNLARRFSAPIWS